MSRFLWVCLGGAAGTGARYLLSGWAFAAFGANFPWGTFAVNVIGSFFAGLLLQIGVATPGLSPTLRHALSAGVLGGFTTYSAFNTEMIRSFSNGEWRLAVANLALTLVTCLAAGLAGVALGRSIFGG